MTPATLAFLRAAADGDANLVRGLLAQGTDVDSVNGSGQTALMLAAGFRRHDVVRVLLAAGANLETQDDLGFTAAEWANNDPTVIGLIDQRNSTPVQPTETQQESPANSYEAHPKPSPIPTPTRNVEPSVDRHSDEPKLKGLAGAILRDHKPRLEEHAHPRGASYSAVQHDVLEDVKPEESLEEHAPVSPPVPIPVESPEPIAATPIDDETLDKPLRALTEDTAATRPVVRSQSRIFDLSEESDPPKVLSKVEVSVPEPARRSYAFVWVLLLVLLVGVGFGAYRLVKSYFTSQPAKLNQPAPPKTETTQPTSATKHGPVVSGELVGAELYVPDAQYPSEAQGKTGSVSVQVQVSSKGIVFGAKAIEGDELFRDAAEKAAKGSAFSPDKLTGKSKVIEGTITYEFAPPKASPADKTTQHGVTVTAGGPLSGAELNLATPDSHSSNGPTGEFTVVVRVNRAGRVMSWRPLNGDARLKETVINAAKRSTFSPEKLPGNGEVVGTLTYSFH